MKAFLITGQGPIDAAQGSEAEASTGLVVKTRGELAKAVEQWPASRLIEFWNQIPGVQPVREFTSRTTALTRIGVTKPTAACCGLNWRRIAEALEVPMSTVIDACHGQNGREKCLISPRRRRTPFCVIPAASET